ncbi:hypothetical protein R6Z02_14510 [Carnobacterium maltaromaticum]|uniref:hypothetical protein n=1 Tax=Carnobacterium maltaromaticum TaxID=2751 RepID=UPI00298B7481|nr:hypothetical protein [Carnobacterium maltaromaticum]MDW5524968.1 hypothetical protein [Carnobacterium maltaromaticum]
MKSFQQFFNREVEENELNKLYQVGETIRATSEMIQGEFVGQLLKKYTYSCLIDLSNNHQIPQKKLDRFNYRIIVSYRNCQIIPAEVIL